MKFKYNNKPTEVDGIKFDSIKESKRYIELKLLERAKEISGLQLQVPFELLPAQTGGIRNELALKYIADFVYFDNKLNREIIEDVKGVETDAFKIKRKLMKAIGKEITVTY